MGWAMVAIIGILFLVPGTLLPHTGLPSQSEHFAAYFITAATLVLSSCNGVTSALRIGSALGVYAGLLETTQLWVPGRSSRLIDFVVGFLGAIVGCIFTVLVCNFYNRPSTSR